MSIESNIPLQELNDGSDINIGGFQLRIEHTMQHMPLSEKNVEDELIQVTQRYHRAVIDSVIELQSELLRMNNNLHDQKDLYERFRQSIDANNRQIDILSNSISAERDARIQGMDQLTRSIKENSDAADGVSSGMILIRNAIAQNMKFSRRIYWTMLTFSGISTIGFLIWLGIHLR